MPFVNQDKENKADVDLTPMIDCVFLLLIFFMIITEITQTKLEHMQLPKAEMADIDKPNPKEERLVLNIIKEEPNNEDNRAGIYKVDGQILSAQQLIPVLHAYAEGDRDELGISEKQVMIRCDRRVEFRSFQRILMLCANPNLELPIKIYRLQIAIAKDETQYSD